MGICLDTEQNNDDLETTGGERTRGASAWAGRATPPTAAFPMQNTSHVKFEPPNVPVVFVLGGPGSGKVTHCDNLMQERRGVIHINMTDLLQQYAIGNDMQDFGMLSSKTVTEVLMLEMKMAPSAKTYLVSGYPRSMRDVAEYSDKIQTITGVVLVSWRQRVLERQIEYGARLGHVVLSLARMELNNFYKNVMPVADYFDQTNMLVAINGERNPEEVYKDFRAAILQILGNEDEQTVNGVSGVGVGAGGIPGEIVGVEPAPAVEPVVVDVLEEKPAMLPTALPVLPAVLPIQPVLKEPERIVSPKPAVIKVRGSAHAPAVLWVVGGPGSNKAVLCQRAVDGRDGWTHFSLGQRLRTLAESGGGPASDAAAARNTLAAGELAPPALVQRLVAAAVDDAARTGDNLVIDSYPRDSGQMEDFQNKYGTSPRMVLLDCSKLQLGRGRRDDSVAAFRRRLEVFRELSLPMLKFIDQQHRLVIVDGDTDAPDVQAEFTRVLRDEMHKAELVAAMPPPPPPPPPAQTTNDGIKPGMTSLQHFAHAMSRMGNGMANGAARSHGALNGGLAVTNTANVANMANGVVGRGNNKIKPSINNVPRVPTVSQMTQDDVRRLYEQSSGEVHMNTHM